MTSLTKSALALVLAGALTAGAASSASARSWKPWAAAGAGFAAGAIVGSALAGPRHYGPGYSGYAYEPGYAVTYDTAPAYDAYAYAPGYDAYAYSPGAAYASTVAAPRYYGGYGQDAGYSSCATQGNYGGKIDYGAC